MSIERRIMTIAMHEFIKSLSLKKGSEIRYQGILSGYIKWYFGKNNKKESETYEMYLLSLRRQASTINYYMSVVNRFISFRREFAKIRDFGFLDETENPSTCFDLWK